MARTSLPLIFACALVILGSAYIASMWIPERMVVLNGMFASGATLLIWVFDKLRYCNGAPRRASRLVTFVPERSSSMLSGAPCSGEDAAGRDRG